MPHMGMRLGPSASESILDNAERAESGRGCRRGALAAAKVSLCTL
jgi:hypothetical protein